MCLKMDYQQVRLIFNFDFPVVYTFSIEAIAKFQNCHCLSDDWFSSLFKLKQLALVGNFLRTCRCWLNSYFSFCIMMLALFNI